MTGSRAIWFVALTVIFVACVLEEEFRAMPEEERRTSVADEPDWHLHCLLSPFGDVPSLRQLEQSLEDWSRRRTKASCGDRWNLRAGRQRRLRGAQEACLPSRSDRPLAPRSGRPQARLLQP